MKSIFKKMLMAALVALGTESTFAQCQLSVNLVFDSLFGNCSSAVIAHVSGSTAPVTYTWYGTGAVINDSAYCWQGPGSGALVVTVTDATGCHAVDTFNNNPCQNLQLFAVVDTGLACTSGSVGFSAGGSIANQPGVQFQWISNGASIGTTNSICAPMTNSISLVATVNQCTLTAFSGNYCNLSAQIFVNPAVVCPGGQYLQATVSGGHAPFTYLWSNGSSQQGVCGNMSDSVVVTDAWGCSARATLGNCNNYSVQAYFDSSIHCANGGAAFRAYTSLNHGTVSYRWSYNGAVQDTSYLACLPANTPVTLTASDLFCTISTNINTNQYCGNLHAYAVPDSGLLCLIGSGYDIVVSGGNAPYNYVWNNGGVGYSTCAQIGDSVKVTDSWGCSTTVVIGQNSGNCNTFGASAYYDSSAICPAGFPFQIVAYGGTPPYQYFWSDPSLQGANVCISFNNVCVTVTDSHGCATTTCNSNSPACQAYFYWFPDSGSNNNIRFYNASVYNPVSAFWDFGDGDTSYSMYPNHVYTTPGTYTVCLLSTDASGCSSTACQVVTIQTPHSDVAAELYHYSTITPGFPLYTYVAVTNMGSFMEQGTLVYKYPQGVTVTNAAGGVVNTANRTITFNYSGLMPYNAEPFAVGLLADAGLALGTISYDSVWVTTTNADNDLSNNLAVMQDSVVGSWDPNDKSVSPKGIGSKGVIPTNTKTLNYLVHFQNTGTAAAQNVRINDVIDSHFDLTTLRVTAASHPHRTSVVNGELIVNFDNIMLPDSNADYAGSQGYVAYTINLKPGISPGTEVTNTANIYFDFNDAVVTNTTTNKLGFNPNGIEESLKNRVTLVPNPASERVFIGGIDGRATNYALFNTLGQEMVSGSLNTNRTIAVNSLENGVYSLRLNVDGTTITRQLVIAR